jgi:hypothetical protein
VAQTFGAGSPVAMTGLDRFGRNSDLKYVGHDPSTGHALTPFEGQYEYDESGNRIRDRLSYVPFGGNDSADRSWLYSSDPLDRLITAQSGRLNTAGTDGTASGSFAAHHFTNERNELTTRREAMGDPPEDNTSAPNTPGATKTPSDPGRGVVYDRAGRMVYDGHTVYRYDAWGRVVEVDELGSASVNTQTGQVSGTLGALVVHYSREYPSSGEAGMACVRESEGKPIGNRRGSSCGPGTILPCPRSTRS